jgi:hypothetical protein
MSRTVELQEELRKLMLAQSESLQQQTFLGINERELNQQEQRIRHIRELFGDLLALLHDNSLSSDMLHSDECPHCSAANRSSVARGAMDEKAKVTLPGTVDKIIPPIRLGAVEKAQISVEGAEPLLRRASLTKRLELRIRCNHRTGQRYASRKALK